MVYPACAGIDLLTTERAPARVRLPRMRGDRPEGIPIPQMTKKFTPHARGSTWFADGKKTASIVYPACAGIDHSGRRF